MNSAGKEQRAFLGIYFRCCGVYGRIYRNRERTEYRGGCPRCGKPVAVPIGKNGSSTRFFIAS